MKIILLNITLVLLTSITSSSCYAANQNKDWVKVGEGITPGGPVQSFIDMNDIRRINADTISFRFVTNVPSVNASHAMTVLLNCKTDLYNIIDDRIYGGLLGNGEASDSVSHGSEFMIVKGTPFETVAKLVCANKI
jgi:hypothetical protein